MQEPRSITLAEQRSILDTAATPGYRLICDIIQAEIDNTLSQLEDFEATAVNEAKYLGYFRALRRILFHLKSSPRQIQLAIRREVNPNSTEALFVPGAADELDVTADELWGAEDPLSPKNTNNSGVVVE